MQRSSRKRAFSADSIASDRLQRGLERDRQPFASRAGSPSRCWSKARRQLIEVLPRVRSESLHVNFIADIDRHHVLADFNRPVVVLPNQRQRLWTAAVREHDETRPDPREDLARLDAVGMMVRHFPTL